MLVPYLSGPHLRTLVGVLEWHSRWAGIEHLNRSADCRGDDGSESQPDLPAGLDPTRLSLSGIGRDLPNGRGPHGPGCIDRFPSA